VIESSDGAIERLKSRTKGMKNELNILQEKERTLVRDVELMSQSLQVFEKVPDQVVQGLQSEIEELATGIETFLQDETEDAFNQLIISTEEKIINLFTFKNNLLDIMFVKRAFEEWVDLNDDGFKMVSFIYFFTFTIECFYNIFKILKCDLLVTQFFT